MEVLLATASVTAVSFAFHLRFSASLEEKSFTCQAIAEALGGLEHRLGRAEVQATWLLGIVIAQAVIILFLLLLVCRQRRDLSNSSQPSRVHLPAQEVDARPPPVQEAADFQGVRVARTPRTLRAVVA